MSEEEKKLSINGLQGLDLFGSVEKPIVLIVDDDNDLRALLEKILCDEAEIVLARSGNEGLALYRERRPDLIFLDWQMPNGDGEEFLITARRDLQDRSTPIILMSSEADGHNAHRFRRLGANYFLSKPLAPREVINAVRFFSFNDETELQAL